MGAEEDKREAGEERNDIEVSNGLRAYKTIRYKYVRRRAAVECITEVTSKSKLKDLIIW